MLCAVLLYVRGGGYGRNDIEIDIQEVGCEGMDRINLAQDRDRWRALMNVAMNYRGSIQCGEFIY